MSKRLKSCKLLFYYNMWLKNHKSELTEIWENINSSNL